MFGEHSATGLHPNKRQQNRALWTCENHQRWSFRTVDGEREKEGKAGKVVKKQWLNLPEYGGSHHTMCLGSSLDYKLSPRVNSKA